MSRPQLQLLRQSARDVLASWRRCFVALTPDGSEPHGAIVATRGTVPGAAFENGADALLHQRRGGVGAAGGVGGSVKLTTTFIFTGTG